MTQNPIKINTAFSVSVKSGYMFNYFKLGETNNNFFVIKYSNWTNERIELEKGIYKSCVKKLNDTDITVTESSNFILDANYTILPKNAVQHDIVVKPRPVILDTDWWTDVDDAIAIRTLLWGERCGMVDIMGIVLDAVKDTSVQSLDTFLNYEGRSGLCIAKESDGTDFGGIPSYHNSILNAWKYSDYKNNNCEESTNFYRRALSSLSDDEKADIICIGYLNAFSKLLNSEPDEYSELDGKTLVNQKVRKVYCMGGYYPTGKENNFSRNKRAVVSAQNVCFNCPVEIIFLGWEVGNTVLVGNTIKDTIGTNDLIYKSLLAHGGTSEANNGRSAWDPMLVLMALYDDFNASGYTATSGNVIVTDDGSSSFDVNSTGMHKYVTKKYSDEWYQYQLNSIIEKKCWPMRNLGNKQLSKI